MVEFALSVSVFVIILVGLFDLGRGVWNYNALSQAAREGARLASVQANWIGQTGGDCTVPNCPATPAAFEANVLAALNEHVAGVGTISSAQVEVHCSSAPPPDNSSWSGNNCSSNNTSGGGRVVTVRVEFTFTPLIAIGSVDMSSQTSMVIN
ncbi:MAG: TadE/TadG family type IV pilus assembly protein [Candidatus Limnocylindria bacterium]